MSAQIVNIAELQERYSGTYEFNATSEPDADYRKYLARRLGDAIPLGVGKHPGDALPLDISLDDMDGDVVAGISAVTVRGVLSMDYLWVDAPMRDQGIGRRLVQMAEEEARARFCNQARIAVTQTSVAFFTGLGYTITGVVQQLTLDRSGPARQSIYWLSKELF